VARIEQNEYEVMEMKYIVAAVLSVVPPVGLCFAAEKAPKLKDRRTKRATAWDTSSDKA